MKFTLPLRHGVKSAWHHLGLVFLLYLASLVPALVAGLVAFARYADATGHSLFARRAFAGGNMYGIIDDFGRGWSGDLTALETLLPIFLLLTVVVHVCFAAGLVETLLERQTKRERPFLLGIGRHSWRFVRSGLWFLIVLGVLGGLVMALSRWLVADYATSQASSALQVWLGLACAVLAAFLFAFLDLGYDLSRISAAAHDDGRTFLGYFKGLGHALKHPMMLLPLWFFFSLVVFALHLGLTAFRNGWQPASTGEVLILIVVQQVVFLVAAFFRVGLWGAEVAYYQAIGEPRWCGKKEKKKRQPAPAPQPAAAEAAVEAPSAVTVHRQPLPVDGAPIEPPAPIESPASPETPTAPEPLRPSWESAGLDDEEGEEEEDEGDGTGPSSM